VETKFLTKKKCCFFLVAPTSALMVGHTTLGEYFSSHEEVLLSIFGTCKIEILLQL
jgi:hypothetical protein